MGTLKNASDVRGKSGILATVRECCATRQQALAVSVNTGTMHQSHFVSADDHHVSLALDDPGAGSHFLPVSPVFVVFQLPAGANAFMAHVREVEGSILHLLPPIGALSAKGRSVFRIPLLEGHGLEVQILCESEARISASALDISVAGVQVEFARDQLPELAIGSVVKIQLSYRGRSTTLNGLVRRAAKCGYGFSFPGCMVDGELSPHPELQEIVAGIQRHWLAHGCPQAEGPRAG